MNDNWIFTYVIRSAFCKDLHSKYAKCEYSTI